MKRETALKCVAESLRMMRRHALAWKQAYDSDEISIANSRVMQGQLELAILFREDAMFYKRAADRDDSETREAADSSYQLSAIDHQLSPK